MKVLIAYGTRYGSTEEISQEIAKVLGEKSFEVEVFNLGITKSKNWPKVDEFDGLLVGTSLKINSWKKQVKTFIEKNKEKLKTLKFGVFTCGAWAIAEPIDAHEEIARRLTKNFGLKADIYSAYGGVLDFSEDSKVGRAGKLALKATALGLEKDKDIPVDKEKINDFRDWDKIRRFAADFAALLR